MTTVNVTEARANLYKLIDDASVSHEPVVITGKDQRFVALRCIIDQFIQIGPRLSYIYCCYDNNPLREAYVKAYLL